MWVKSPSLHELYMPVIVINENYLLTEQGRGEADCSFKGGFPLLNLCYMTHKLKGLNVYLRVCLLPLL